MPHEASRGCELQTELKYRALSGARAAEAAEKLRVPPQSGDIDGAAEADFAMKRNAYGGTAEEAAMRLIFLCRSSSPRRLRHTLQPRCYAVLTDDMPASIQPSC